MIVFENGCYDTSACFTISTVDVIEILNVNVVIYPNPTTSGNFTVLYDGTLISIEVIDVLGRIISLPVELSSGQVDGTSLAQGRYSVRIFTNEGITTKEIVIQR